MKYKITKFTKEEKEDIVKRYGEWMQPENSHWVKEEFEKYTDDYSLDSLREYPFAKSYAEKQWVAEKLKDQLMHSSVYIDSRIGDFTVLDFNDVTG